MAGFLKQITAVSCLVFLATPTPGDAATTMSRAPVEVWNRADQPIVCIAQIAHWFSFDLGRAAPNEAVRGSLHSDPATGTVFLLNGTGDHLPVEALWCGVEGRAWETRSPLVVVRRKGEPTSGIRASCDIADGRLRCR